MSNKIRRDFACEMRAAQDAERGSYIEGSPIVYGVYADIGGMYQEIIEPGALEKTDLRDVRFLVNHNLSMIPLARSRRNNPNSTMQLITHEKGLDIRAELDTERNATARELYSAVERKDIAGMSFLFFVGDEVWENLGSDYPTRRIKSFERVLEVSAVTDPAYSQTSIEARTADAKALESARAALESAKAKADREQLKTHMNEIIRKIGGK